MPEKYRPLIEKIIKNNTRYSGNEDLFEDFCSETFKRSYKILSGSTDIKSYEAYLNKVASSAILEVLRNTGRIRRLRSGYKNIITESTQKTYNTDSSGEIVFEIEDPSPSVEDKLIQEEEVNKIRAVLTCINEEYPGKDFLKIFQMRYVEGKKQLQIAEHLGLSQGEVSKRLIELSKRVLSRLHAS